MKTRSRFTHWEQLEKISKPKTHPFKRFLKIIINLLLLCMVVIFFWGFGTIIFNSNVSSTEIKTTGFGPNAATAYETRIFFDITYGFEDVIKNSDDKLKNFKRHILFIHSSGELQQYRYYLANDFQSMWETSKSAAYVFFVLPVSWILTKISLLFGWSVDAINSGNKNLFSFIGALFLTTLGLRLLGFVGAWQQKKNQTKMEAIKEQQAIIKAKYADSQDPNAKQKERQETMLLYKQQNVNPFSAALQGFAFAPLLLTVFIVVRYSRIVKLSGSEVFSLTRSIWTQISSNFTEHAIYLVPSVIYLIIFGTDFAVSEFWLKKQNTKFVSASPSAKKGPNKQKWIQYGMKVMFLIFFFIVPTGTSLYWIFSSFFELGQKLFLEFLSRLQKKRAVLRKKGKTLPLWKLIFYTPSHKLKNI